MVSSWVEPEWNEEDRELILAAEIVERMTGPNGEWMPDATSDEADPMSYSGYRYVPGEPRTNWAEKARLDAIDAYRKAAGDEANLNGMYWPVERFDY